MIYKFLEDKEPPEFRIKVVKYSKTALERQIGEATRILLRKSVLNSKAGYNRSGVARLTLNHEDIQPAWVDRNEAARRLKDKGNLEMLRKAEEHKAGEEASTRKRGAEEKVDLNRKHPKRKRGLKHGLETTMSTLSSVNSGQ